MMLNRSEGRILTCANPIHLTHRASGCEGCPGQEFCLRVSSAGKSEEQKMLETRMSTPPGTLFFPDSRRGQTQVDRYEWKRWCREVHNGLSTCQWACFQRV